MDTRYLTVSHRCSVQRFFLFNKNFPMLQVVASGARHSPNRQSKIPIIQGELAPTKNIKADGSIEINTKLPMILITAHMETFGLVNVSSQSHLRGQWFFIPPMFLYFCSINYQAWMYPCSCHSFRRSVKSTVVQQRLQNIVLCSCYPNLAHY